MGQEDKTRQEGTKFLKNNCTVIENEGDMIYYMMYDVSFLGLLERNSPLCTVF